MNAASHEAPQRVVVTGIGLVSPLGSSPQALWEALSAGRSGVARSSVELSPELSLRFAGEAPQFTGAIGDFGPLEGAQKKAIRKGLKLMCRETQMAVAAAQMAVTDSACEAGVFEPERSGVVLGSDYMLTMPVDYEDSVAKCTDENDFQFEQWGGTGLDNMQPLWMLKYLPNMPASHIAIFNDLRGPNNSLTLREASGLMAIGEAFRIIARGHADRMIAGATGTRILPMQAIHTMQTEKLADQGDDPAAASRPFDKHRQGMVAGEGAGMVMLESLAQAQARGARIYGEVVGFGSSMVATPKLEGKTQTALANAMRSALQDAKTEPATVGHLNTHGLATAAGDQAEAAAIAEVFGEASPPAVALKSYFGNLGAGGGVVELAASLLALGQTALPKVLNYQTPDPDCPVNAVTADEVAPGESCLATNVTPQGQAAAIVVRSCS